MSTNGVADANQPLPYYQWFWRDHRAHRRAQKLSLAAEGALRRLLDEQWSEGMIPAEPHNVAEILGCSTAEVREVWPAIESFFQPADQPGFLVNKRLEGVRTKADHDRAQKKRAGRLGGIAKVKAQLELVADAQHPLGTRLSRAEQEQSIAAGETVAPAKQPLQPEPPKRMQPHPPASPLLPQAALTSNGDLPAKATAPPPAPPSPFEEEVIELPLAVIVFTQTFYGRAKPERLADVERQLRATLTPAGCSFEAVHVRALDRAHLTACAVEVCTRVLNNPDVAVTILLKRVRETYLERHSAAMKQLEGVH